MAAPSPESIVTNPPPLNERTRRFPFRVDPFPASWLLDFAGLGRSAPVPEPPANPQRWED